MMTTTSAINKRRSIRSYQNKKIPKKILGGILSLANLAPTTAGLENRHFIVINDQKTKQKLYEAGCKQNYLLEAPVVIAIVTNVKGFLTKKQLLKINEDWQMDFWGGKKKFEQNYQVWRQLYPLQDAAVAGATLLLAATEKGLGSCWLGAFDYLGVEKILQLPENWKVTCLITLGYPKDKPYQQKRTKIEKLIHENRW